MKISKLDNEFFFDFMLEKFGVDARLFKDDTQVRRKEDKIVISVYLGGESEDERKFSFKDNECLFKNCAQWDRVQNVSREWVMYLLDNADVFTQGEMYEIVESYNQNIENDIAAFVQQRKSSIINL